jgi:deoxyribonuclease-4
MLLGAHVSIAGGLDTAIDRGVALGVNSIQSFASSPRTLKTTYPSREILNRYQEKRQLSQIKCHVFHGIYLINLAHENPNYRRLCIDSLLLYQQLAGEINGLGTIFHLGSHTGRGFPAVREMVVIALVEIIAKTPPKINLILENAAGQGGTLGVTLEELSLIFSDLIDQNVDLSKVGLGIDTQHAFASGLALHTPSGLNDFLAKIEVLFGLDKLKLIHFNDSAVPFMSNKDRHANLGTGYLGTEGLANIINHPQLRHLPFILEVPGTAKAGPGLKDVEMLTHLVKS